MTDQASGAADVLGAIEAVEMPDPDFRAVLAITPYRRLWLALGFSSFGDWLGLLAITAMADYLAGSNPNAQYLAVAGVFILRLAPAVVLGPLAGALADRISRRWVLVYGDVLRFLILITVPFVGTLWNCSIPSLESASNLLTATFRKSDSSDIDESTSRNTTYLELSINVCARSIFPAFEPASSLL